MSRRRAQLVLLCEDRQHEAFVRRFLKHSGWDNRNIRVEKSPTGRGCGEQWVRARYAKEIGGLRSAPHIARALVVTIDEDTGDIGHRERQLAEALASQGLTPRGQDEPVLHVVPARNIETWLAYLGGQEVDETATYPKRMRQKDCSDEALELKKMCDRGALREPAPLSLKRACLEYRSRLAII